MVEWVQPKHYDKFEFPFNSMLGGVTKAIDTETGKRAAEKNKAAKEAAKAKAKEKPSPSAIKAPPEKPVEKKPQSKARPHPGKRGEIGPGPAGPGSDVALRAKPGPVGPRTVADEEAGRQARAELVKSVMDKRNEGKYSDRRGWRNAANLNTGAIHTGVVSEDPRAVGGGRTPLALPTRGTASTGILPTIGRTQEIPRVTPHDQTIEFDALPTAKKPFAVRTPIPVGSGRSAEQLSMFHVPGEPVNPSLSTRQQSPIAMPSGSRVAKLAARPTPGKKPGDQGVLFQPARYRSVH